MHSSISKHTREEKKRGKILGVCEPAFMKLYEDSYKKSRQGKRDKNYRYRKKNVHYKFFLYNYHCLNNIYLHQ